jgi:hypothetical protein
MPPTCINNHQHLITQRNARLKFGICLGSMNVTAMSPVTGKLVVLCVPSHINTYQHLPMQPIVPRVLHVQLPANAPCGRLRAGMDWELL